MSPDFLYEIGVPVNDAGMGRTLTVAEDRAPYVKRRAEEK
jgi:hypothetical protein